MKPKRHQIDHSAKFRRQALFPVNENSSIGLECVVPLKYDSDDECGRSNSSLNDYDILDVKVHSSHGTPQHTKISLDSSSTVKNSSSPNNKTPQDIPDNTKLPRLARKPAIEIENTDFGNHKNSKIRTTLFPEKDKSVFPPKNFPKTSSVPSSKFAFRKTMNEKRKPLGSIRKGTSGRRSKNRLGQINAGVSHGIRKIKKGKKLSVTDAHRIFDQLTQNSPLNEYLPSLNTIVEEPAELPNNSPPSPLIKPAITEPSLISASAGFEQPDLERPESPDPNKKFFKNSRLKGIVTLNNGNLKVEVKKGRISLLKETKQFGGFNVDKFFNSSEANFEKFPKDSSDDFDEPLIASDCIDDLIETLDEDEEQGKNLKSINLDVLMSPTSQMCNMTSGLAINSPGKSINLNSVLDSVPSDQSTKLFPIFYQGQKRKIDDDNKCCPSKNEKSKKMKYIRDKTQMLLDAGQKHFGVVQCTDCDFVYHVGDPDDEMLHQNYHNAIPIFQYNGWKNERIIYDNSSEGKVIHVLPGDSQIWWKKINSLVEVVNRHLGYFDLTFNLENSQVFLYIKHRKIVGVLIAEQKHFGHKLLTTPADQVDLCSEINYPIKCGVSRIWVSPDCRKSGIGSTLMDCLKRFFEPGCTLANEDIALSSPTKMGKLFGISYFKTPNFLIYFS